ncbi:MAG: prolipoprotein diacylglyceryl transferase, partial [Moraxellaceae bacterium]|nr:prolipoprotein diacylglyceryl transferase [Pseudobdellovibrionaceae bacterium]
IVGPVGVFFGRIANFINGELVGRVAPADFAYGVKFPTDILNWPGYEFDRLATLSPVVEKVNVTGSQWLEWMGSFRSNQVSRDQVYSTLNKIVAEIQTGNNGVKEAIAPFLDYRYPSQLFAAVTEGIITFTVLFFLARKSRHPGFIAGSFILCYATMRTFNEMFRMPDLQIGFQLFGLTRGQWLSIVMFVIGIVMMIYWRNTQSSTVHGWSRGENVRLRSRNLR